MQAVDLVHIDYKGELLFQIHLECLFLSFMAYWKSLRQVQHDKHKEAIYSTEILIRRHTYSITNKVKLSCL